MASEPVLVDTCMWVSFFNRPQSKIKKVIDELLDDDRVMMIGPVLAEVLVGFRREQQAQWVASFLSGTEFESLRWDDWCHVASLERQLKSKGHDDVPQTDCVVAATALDRRWLVYSDDPHFDLIDWLPRFRPE